MECETDRAPIEGLSVTNVMIVEETYTGTRPRVCRLCSRPIGHDERHLIDVGHPWLCLHSDCLGQILPERIEAAYDALASGTPVSPSALSSIRKQLEQLAYEVRSVQELLDGDRREIVAPLRPGRRRGPVS